MQLKVKVTAVTICTSIQQHTAFANAKDTLV
jgi:hypothetical protein